MKVIADSSAWIEFFRRTGTATDLAMRKRLLADEIATTDVVMLEILAGASDAARLAKARRAIDACTYLAQRRLFDARAAAEMYRDCRRGGETPRQLTDCLVAAVAVRCDVSVLHNDRDFDVIARHTSLETAIA